MRVLHVAFWVLILAPGMAAAAAAPPPGASSCTGCHAEARQPQETAFQSIRGRPAGEIADAMRAYAAGGRPATVMDRIAKGFSEDEIQAIAAWISAQPRRAEP